MVSKGTVNRLSARLDAIARARQPDVVVIKSSYADRDGAVERRCAAHPEDRGAALYVILLQFD